MGPMGYQPPPTDKSVGVAFLLTFFFGPLGMFYTDVVPAILMVLAAIVLGIFTFGLALPFIWIGSIIWGCVSASNQHSRFLASLALPPGMGGPAGLGGPYGAAAPWGVAPPSSAVAAGWYPDPYAAGQFRWWDGAQWTHHQGGATPPQPPS
jgi:hypothetical protein